MEIGLIGAGYVGLVSGLCFSSKGHRVNLYDSDENKLHLLKAGKTPFYEPGLEELLNQELTNLTISNSLIEVVHNNQILILAVNTPENSDGSTDLSNVIKITEQICLNSNSEKLVILKSTVPVGTTKKIQQYFDDHSKFKIHVVVNPEFLRQGSAIEDFLSPQRILVGADNDFGKEIMKKVYTSWIENNTHFILIDSTSAELAKYAANSFLALKISFINELAKFSHLIEADIEQVKLGFTSDSRIGDQFFQQGLGFGGSCFPKDLHSLIFQAHQLNLELPILKAADQVNNSQIEYYLNVLKKEVSDLKNKKIAIWGLSFKSNTDDMRRSPSLNLINSLLNYECDITVFDPVVKSFELLKTVNNEKICQSQNAISACKDADALFILTDWKDFSKVDLYKLKIALKNPLIIDCRNIFEPKTMDEHKFQYFSLGRSNYKSFSK